MMRPAYLAPLLLLLGATSPAATGIRPGVEIWRLKCGPDKPLNLDIFSDTYDYGREPKTFVFSCYLIRDGDRYLLWDAGLPPTERTRILEQLKQIGVTADQITFLGISHNHNDHIAQAADFPKATLLMGAEDWRDVQAGGTLSDSSTNSREKLAPWVTGVSKVDPITRDRDVFGDGRVVILKTPGHTPGHQSLLIKLERIGNVLLTGDLYHFRRNREQRIIPIFNTNRADTLGSMDRFERIAKTLRARVIIQHEGEDIDKLPAFPASAD